MIWLFMMMPVGVLTDALLQRRLKLNKKPCTVIFSLLSCTLLVTAFDDPIWILKGCIFVQTLILIGYLDSKTRRIPDLLLLPIVLCGLIRFDSSAAILGMTVIPVVMLIFAITIGGIGGGDIKLTAACGFVLGFWDLIPAVIIAFSLSTLTYLIFKWDKDSGCPMAPYISLGCFIIYLQGGFYEIFIETVF